MGLSGNKTLSHAPVSYTEILPTKVKVDPFLSYTETANSHISTGFYGDVTGRLGWAWGPWMFYGKGGLAVLQAKTNVTDTAYTYSGTTFFSQSGGNDHSRVGWTAGAGFEYLWGPAWSVKVEYQYFDFGTASSTLTTGAYSGSGAPSPFASTYAYTNTFNHSLDINTVKVGLNYHLGCCDGGGYVPLK